MMAMKPYLDDPDYASPDEVDAFVQSHTQFHAAIGSLVQNRVLELTLQTYGQIVSHHVAVTDDPRALQQLIADHHLKLAKAIAAGHATRARTLMEEHIRAVAHYSEVQLGSELDAFIEWQ